MTSKTIYNLDLMYDKTTNLDSGVMAHMINIMATNQDNVDMFDKPSLFTNESASFGTENTPYVIIDDEWINSINLCEFNDDDFPFYIPSTLD